MLYDFKEFLKSDHILSDTKLIFCVPDKIPAPVFASFLIAHLKAQNKYIESIELPNCKASGVISQLETSFLGMGITYWLLAIDQIDKKYHHEILQYLKKYTGPHQVILFLSQADARMLDTTRVITIPEKVSQDIFVSLYNFLRKKAFASQLAFIKELYTHHDRITIDQACMIISYMQVLGRYQEMEPLLSQILESEKSLFTLSQFFFAKNGASFFKLWDLYQKEYSELFWCTFWGEQVWRAYYARYFLERKQIALAKNVGFRLPFTFMQKDWTKSTFQELKNAHQYIYELDLAYKNNLETQLGLDLFYTKFFLGEFKS